MTAKCRSPITLHVAPVSNWHYNSVKYDSSRSEKIILALNCLPGVSTLETSSILKSGSSLSVACDLYVLSFLMWACFSDDRQMQSDLASNTQDMFDCTLYALLSCASLVNHICCNSSSCSLYPLDLSFYRATICHLVVSLDCPRRWRARLLGFDPVSWIRAV